MGAGYRRFKASENISKLFYNSACLFWRRPKREPVMPPDDADDITDHEGIKNLLKLPSVNTVHYLRRRGKIPHNRLHYRCITYSKTKVLAALGKLEHKAVADGRV